MGVVRDLRRSEPQLLFRYGTLLTVGAAVIIVALQVGGWRISALNAVSIYLLLTLLSATTFGFRTGLLAAALSYLLISFCFLEPIFGFAMSDRQYLASLPVFFIVAVVGASLRTTSRPLASGRSVATPAPEPEPTPVPVGEPLLDLGSLQLDLANHALVRDGREVHLTPTELKLLTFFIANPGRVLRPQEILVNVWGIAYAQDVRVLRTYINQLRVKLNDKLTEPRFIRTEPGFGYRFLVQEARAALASQEAGNRNG